MGLVIDLDLLKFPGFFGSQCSRFFFTAESVPGFSEFTVTLIIMEIDEAELAAEFGVEDLTAVNAGLFEGIGEILSDTALNFRRMAPAGRGIEFWRLLYAKWRRNSPEVAAVNREWFFKPNPAKNLESLQDVLLQWEFLGRQLAEDGGRSPTRTSSSA